MINQIYATPKLVKFGKSKDLIQGSCGWGAENVYLDKTDYHEYVTKKCVGTNCEYVTICSIQDLPHTCAQNYNCS
ncbi:hypothetical protein Back11_34140 [Paenibacillus baekrokdamisoli]|uniref:Uncharacterized protein n=1 Tax=Paenibacillus baekrokdamisoli TaxID=1712516 RepID=A0A3G9JGG9_9BACL|nr:hypothetical protein [Paenibacillus baekrokdamisoli]BBH22069.1 hypothetical protein Back11_34140 [Paenibacillus baekrokdamisoli]